MNKEVAGEQHSVKVLDEIGLEMKAKQIEAIKREYDHFKSTLADKKVDLAQALEAQKVDLDVYALVLEGDNCRKLQPEFRYEELEQYWDLKHKQTEVQQQSFLRKSNKAVSDLQSHIKQVEEQLESCGNKIKELGGSVE